MIKEKIFKQAEISTLQKNKTGKNCCGDSFFLKETDEYLICAVADGLGSGEEAKESSAAAISVVKANHDEDISYIMEKCNKILRNKRGVVISIFKAEFARKEISYCCVGNIRFELSSPSGKSVKPLPDRGFLSGRPHQYRIQQFQYEKESIFFLYSDGLSFGSIRELECIHSPSEITNIVNQRIEQQMSVNDDVTLLVGKFV